MGTAQRNNTTQSPPGVDRSENEKSCQIGTDSTKLYFPDGQGGWIYRPPKERGNFTMTPNNFYDQYEPLIGLACAGLYQMYRRLQMGGRVTRLSLEEIAKAGQIGKATLLKFNRVLEICGLIKVITPNRKQQAQHRKTEITVFDPPHHLTNETILAVQKLGFGKGYKPLAKWLFADTAMPTEDSRVRRSNENPDGVPTGTPYIEDSILKKDSNAAASAAIDISNSGVTESSNLGLPDRHTANLQRVVQNNKSHPLTPLSEGRENRRQKADRLEGAARAIRTELFELPAEATEYDFPDDFGISRQFTKALNSCVGEDVGLVTAENMTAYCRWLHRTLGDEWASSMLDKNKFTAHFPAFNRANPLSPVSRQATAESSESAPANASASAQPAVTDGEQRHPTDSPFVEYRKEGDRTVKISTITGKPMPDYPAISDGARIAACNRRKRAENPFKLETKGS